MYRVRTAITGGQGGPSLSTLHFNVVGGLTAANAVAATATFWTALRTRISNQLTMTVESDVATIDIATGQVTGITATAGAVVTGNDAGDPAPWATQGLIRWRTGIYVGGREIRGRTFIPGVTDTSTPLGVPSAAYLTDLNAAAAALIANAVSDLEVYSPARREAAPAVLGQTWTNFASLRSRRT